MSVGPALVVLIAGALLLVAGPGVVRRLWAAKTAALIEVSRHEIANEDILARLDRANRLVAQSITPSVVHVDVVLEARRGASSGAGWVYDAEGHIVTNAHVVANSRYVQVQFSDGYTQAAEIVGMDVFTDVAVLKVDAGPSLFPMPRSKDKHVEVGDRVFAFGSPFGQKFSVSEGIVSGLGRSARAVMGFTGISNYIQTDAAVNPGNSGGPLVDSAGDLVGMNVAIANALSVQGTPEMGQSAGISFAIPLATIEARVPQIIRGGVATPAIMGIEFRDGPASYIDSDGFRGPGVLVRGVVPDGPAETGGIRAGDRLVSIDGVRVTSSDVMRALITTASPGQDVSVQVQRDDSIQSHVVRLATAPDSFQEAQHLSLLQDRVGLWTIDSNGGVMVARAEPDSPAEDAGFEPGMMVARIGSMKIESERDVGKALIAAGLSRGTRVATVVKLSDGTEKTLYLRVFRLPPVGK